MYRQGNGAQRREGASPGCHKLSWSELDSRPSFSLHYTAPNSSCFCRSHCLLWLRSPEVGKFPPLWSYADRSQSCNSRKGLWPLSTSVKAILVAGNLLYPIIGQSRTAFRNGLIQVKQCLQDPFSLAIPLLCVASDRFSLS